MGGSRTIGIKGGKGKPGSGPESSAPAIADAELEVLNKFGVQTRRLANGEMVCASCGGYECAADCPQLAASRATVEIAQLRDRLRLSSPEGTSGKNRWLWPVPTCATCQYHNPEGPMCFKYVIRPNKIGPDRVDQFSFGCTLHEPGPVAQEKENAK